MRRRREINPGWEAFKAADRACNAAVVAERRAVRAEIAALKADREARRHPDQFNTGLIEAHALQLRGLPTRLTRPSRS
jgi:hypothetical protein